MTTINRGLLTMDNVLPMKKRLSKKVQIKKIEGICRDWLNSKGDTPNEIDTLNRILEVFCTPNSDEVLRIARKEKKAEEKAAKKEAKNKSPVLITANNPLDLVTARK